MVSGSKLALRWFTVALIFALIGNYYRLVYQPDVFHGEGRSLGREFFEGWYYKMVTPDRPEIVSVIVGILDSQEPTNTTAFIMVLESELGAAQTYFFPASEFSASEESIEVTVAGNRFTRTSISLDLKPKPGDDAVKSIRGFAEFEDLHGWPISWLSPGVMSWFAFVPAMQCYHGVVSMHSVVSRGEIFVDSRRIDFTGGVGYSEKDWGWSFPSTWVWHQSSRFTKLSLGSEENAAAEAPAAQKLSVMFSFASVPWYFGISYPGFLIGIQHNEVLYDISAYNFPDILEMSTNGDDEFFIRVKHEAQNVELSLRLDGSRSASPELIYAPVDGHMKKFVKERLGAKAQLRLTEAGSGRLIVEGESEDGGLEIMGDVQGLIEEVLGTPVPLVIRAFPWMVSALALVLFVWLFHFLVLPLFSETRGFGSQEQAIEVLDKKTKGAVLESVPQNS